MTKNHELKVKAREDAKSAFEIEERDRLRHYTPMKSGRKKVKHFNKPSPSKYCKVKHQNTKVVTISVTPSYRDSSKNETKSMHSSHIGQSKVSGSKLSSPMKPKWFQIYVSLKDEVQTQKFVAVSVSQEDTIQTLLDKCRNLYATHSKKQATE